MADPVRSDFESRIKRVMTMHEQGLGLEAPGTLGRSHYTTRKRSIPFVTPLVVLVLGLYSFKALVFHSLGQEAFIARVQDMHAAGGAERFVALLMQPEAVTRAISQVLTSVGF